MTTLIESTPRAVRMSYRIARGEQGVLTFEPYKSELLPLWRFRTVAVARKSAADLWQRFEEFDEQGDFVGMDMARKFIQMGMTRAKRYANHKGGRKYERTKGVKGEEGRVVDEDGKGKQLAKSDGHDGRDEKLAVSEHFKEVWRRCIADERYLEMKREFLAEQKEWDRMQKKVKKEDDGGEVVKVDEEGELIEVAW